MAISSAITKKMAQKLAKPMSSNCKRVAFHLKAMGRPSYEYECSQIKGATKAYRGTSMLPYGMQTAEEANDRDMFTTAGTSSPSSSPPRRSPPSPPQSKKTPTSSTRSLAPSSKVPSTNDSDGNKSPSTKHSNISVQSVNLEKLVYLASVYSRQHMDMAHLGDIYRLDDCAELVPPACPKRKLERWLCFTRAFPARSLFSEGSSVTASLPDPPPRLPAIVLHSASWEEVFLAPYPPTRRFRYWRQDDRYLRTGEIFGDLDEWGSERLRSRSRSRSPRPQPRPELRPSGSG